jgi:hypothetical protein
MEQSRLVQILEELTDRWCERRALRPLALLLPAWPSPLAHTDQWHELWRALRNVNGLPPEALTAEEQELHGEAQRLVNRALRAVGQHPCG